MSISAEMQCLQCGARLGARAAQISLLALGDEYSESYFACAGCGAYTVRVFHDSFMGDAETYLRGPLKKAEGDRVAALIAGCPDPTDKFCDCAAHRSLAGEA